MPTGNKDDDPLIELKAAYEPPLMPIETIELRAAYAANSIDGTIRPIENDPGMPDSTESLTQAICQGMRQVAIVAGERVHAHVVIGPCSDTQIASISEELSRVGWRLIHAETPASVTPETMLMTDPIAWTETHIREAATQLMNVLSQHGIAITGFGVDML